MAKYNFKKDDIIKNLSFTTGFSLNYSKKIINDLVEILIKNIKSGNFNLKNIPNLEIGNFLISLYPIKQVTISATTRAL